MTRKQPGYVSFLLRLWQAESEGKHIWRASLESPMTGSRHGFRNLADLYAYLNQKVNDLSKDDQTDQSASDTK